MPAPRRSAKPKDADRRAAARDVMRRRSDAFRRALDRKGMPMAWGSGVLRSDDAWKRDEQYRREDGR